MKFLGKWKVKNIEVYDENMNRVLMTPEEYINRPMDPWINTNDEEEVEHELEQRKFIVETIILISEDNYMYSLSPLPEGVSQEEIDEAVSSGEIILKDNMMLLEKFE